MILIFEIEFLHIISVASYDELGEGIDFNGKMCCYRFFHKTPKFSEETIKTVTIYKRITQ